MKINSFTIFVGQLFTIARDFTAFFLQHVGKKLDIFVKKGLLCSIVTFKVHNSFQKCLNSCALIKCDFEKQFFDHSVTLTRAPSVLMYLHYLVNCQVPKNQNPSFLVPKKSFAVQLDHFDT